MKTIEAVCKVSVLVSITTLRYKIVGVFSKHEKAVKYADENNVEGWHIYETDFHATMQVK